MIDLAKARHALKSRGSVNLTPYEGNISAYLSEAIDEIESLRAKLANTEIDAGLWDAEIERLREELDDVAYYLIDIPHSGPCDSYGLCNICYARGATVPLPGEERMKLRKRLALAEAVCHSALKEVRLDSFACGNVAFILKDRLMDWQRAAKEGKCAHPQVLAKGRCLDCGIDIGPQP